MRRIISLLRQETMCCVALVAAAISCFFVPPDGAYLQYIDWRTLALLFCLMVVVAGLRSLGVFAALAAGLCRLARTLRQLGLILVALCFFGSMLITNDVALLTFVPLAVAVLSMAGQTAQLPWVVVLQTVAANLGSMLTPVGNPQNIYLYSYYQMQPGPFFGLTAPICLAGGVILALLTLTLPRQALTVAIPPRPTPNRRALAIYLALFALCMAVIFPGLSWPVLLAVLVGVLLIYDRRMLLRADLFLLLTFVCFFVFAGNLARIPAVNTWLCSLLAGHELGAAAVASQCISNVPAAILLSGFTQQGGALLLGVNIGGLGTPIASLASLIGIHLYFHTPGARKKLFWKLFLAVNFSLLIVLMLLGALLV